MLDGMQSSASKGSAHYVVDADCPSLFMSMLLFKTRLLQRCGCEIRKKSRNSFPSSSLRGSWSISISEYRLGQWLCSWSTSISDYRLDQFLCLNREISLSCADREFCLRNRDCSSWRGEVDSNIPSGSSEILFFAWDHDLIPSQ